MRRVPYWTVWASSVAVADPHDGALLQRLFLVRAIFFDYPAAFAPTVFDDEPPFDAENFFGSERVLLRPLQADATNGVLVPVVAWNVAVVVVAVAAAAADIVGAFGVDVVVFDDIVDAAVDIVVHGEVHQ